MEQNDKEHMKPLSIEEAANYLTEHKKEIGALIKKEAHEQPIAFATLTQTGQYLAYCVSLLDDISPSTAGFFFMLMERTKYSKEDIIKLLRLILIAKINLHSNRRIAKTFGIPRTVVNKLELIAATAVKEIIQKKQLIGKPVLGGPRL